MNNDVKFVFVLIESFKFDNNCKVDEKSDYYRKAFIVKDKNHFDTDSNTSYIFDLNSGSLIKYLDISSNRFFQNVYYNQLYYIYNFSNPKEFLNTFDPSNDDIKNAIMIYNRFLQEEKLIKEKKLVRLNKVI